MFQDIFFSLFYYLWESKKTDSIVSFYFFLSWRSLFHHQKFLSFSCLKRKRTFGSRKLWATKEHGTVSFSAWHNPTLTITEVRQNEESCQGCHDDDFPIATTNSACFDSPGGRSLTFLSLWRRTGKGEKLYFPPWLS